MHDNALRCILAASINNIMTFSAYHTCSLYKQFNFGLVPQTFGLVTSSNSLPEGQPHLFIFISPWKVKCLSITMSAIRA